MTAFAPGSPEKNPHEDSDDALSDPPKAEDPDAALTPRELKRHHVGYTRFVGLAKILLTAGAAGLLITLFLWPSDDPPPPTPKGVTIQQGQMVKPRYAGTDEKNRDFFISADAAQQPKADGQVVQLNNPEGDITLDGGWLSLRAKNGHYERTDHMVTLNQGFEIFHDAGYRLIGQEINVDLSKGEAKSQSPVDLFGPSGEVHAKGGLTMESGGSVVIFKGPAHAVIRQQAGP